eukprot:357620-Chlamydomonas_euryale.AAC.2
MDLPMRCMASNMRGHICVLAQLGFIVVQLDHQKSRSPTWKSLLQSLAECAGVGVGVRAGVSLGVGVGAGVSLGVGVGGWMGGCVTSLVASASRMDQAGASSSYFNARTRSSRKGKERVKGGSYGPAGPERATRPGLGKQETLAERDAHRGSRQATSYKDAPWLRRGFREAKAIIQAYHGESTQAKARSPMGAWPAQCAALVRPPGEVHARSFFECAHSYCQ